MLKLDRQYEDFQFRTSELEQGYGNNIHILSDPHLLSLIAKLGSPHTHQPMINLLVEKIYTHLLHQVVAKEFPLTVAEVPTRMSEFHPEGVYRGPVVDPETSCVSVNLARAGTLPSHICYSELNFLLNPSRVRQDHISIARQTNSNQEVTGSQVSGHKIGGSIENAIVLYPDPMGATGATLVEASSLLRQHGTPQKEIAIHCMITPEYLDTIQKHCPHLTVYAARLDRGLSSESTLGTPLGSDWKSEKGLNSHQYIVPGAGGIGEILNNAFV